MKNTYFVVAKYVSKYGTILYCVKVSCPVEQFVFDPDNSFVNTFYYKGSTDIKSNSFVDLSYIKGENGYLYCFD